MKKMYFRIIFIILTLLWMGLIFFLSHQSGESSSEVSDKITSLIIKIFIPDYSDLPTLRQEELFDIFSYVIRKTAHFSEYAILGLLLFLSIKSFVDKNIILYPTTFIIGVLYAISDEFHQSFVSQRAPMLKDVFIDSLGVITMLLFISGIINIVKIKRLGKKYD